MQQLQARLLLNGMSDNLMDKMVVLACGTLISGLCVCPVVVVAFLTVGRFDRLGGVAGSNLQTSQCPSSGSGGTTNCFAAFLALHLTSRSTAYLEVSARSQSYFKVQHIQNNGSFRVPGSGWLTMILMALLNSICIPEEASFPNPLVLSG